MKITDVLLKKMYNHATQTYPRECFGFLVGSFEEGGSVKQVITGTNLNADRNDRFEMDPTEFIKVEQKAEKAELEIIGFYHSHPDWPPIPSQTDILFAWEGSYYVIVSIFQGQPLNTRVWQLAEDSPKRFIPLSLEIVDEQVWLSE